MIATEAVNQFFRHLLFLPPQASSVAHDLDRLHYFVITTTLIASTAIGGVALFFFVRYKRRPGEPLVGQQVRTGALYELFAIGTPLVFFLVWFILGFHEYLIITSPPAGTMDVYVMAKQWMWKFNYPEGPSSIGVLRVPVGRPIKLLMTSRDVIHSLYVPAFRLKRDVLPGRYTEEWFQAVETGTYDIFCAEYCGTGHSMMHAEVVVMKEDAFDTWLANERRGLATRQDSAGGAAQAGESTSADMVAEGGRVAARAGCLKCHSIDGSPHIGPTWLGMYHREEHMSDGQIVNVDEPYITESMMDPMAKIVAGFAPVMPTYQGRLTAPETAAIVEYIKSLRDAQLQAQPSEGPVYEPRASP